MIWPGMVHADTRGSVCLLPKCNIYAVLCFVRIDLCACILCFQSNKNKRQITKANVTNEWIWQRNCIFAPVPPQVFTDIDKSASWYRESFHYPAPTELLPLPWEYGEEVCYRRASKLSVVLTRKEHLQNKIKLFDVSFGSRKNEVLISKMTS